MAPWANPQDGLLDVCTFRYGGFWRGLLYLTMLQWQRHTRLREFDASVATSLHIESPASIAYQIDGDLGGTLPLTIRLIRNRYCMMNCPDHGIARRMLSCKAIMRCGRTYHGVQMSTTMSIPKVAPSQSKNRLLGS
ncbi:MAG: hypothetical protein U0905_12435 [Pirellulales bacterium]